MFFDYMFIQNDILGSAMQAAVVRSDIINNNIANADVPGFKKKTVSFEKYLREKLDIYGATPEMGLEKIKPVIQVTHGKSDYRIDENNVDIESEMVDLYQNSAKYDVLASGVINNYKRINSVFSGIK